MIASLPKAINSLLRFSQNVIGFKEVILIIEEATSKIKVISSLDALMEKSSALTKISKDAFKQQLAIDSHTQLTLLGIPFEDKTPKNNYQQHFEWVLREIEQLLNEARSLKSQRLEYSQSGIFVENLIKNMNEGVIVFDHQNVITHLNNAAHQFLDINKKAQKQMDFIFYEGSINVPVPADLTPSTIALSGGVIHNKIYTLYSEAYPEGGFVKVNANPIRNKDNEIIAAAVTLTNFTSVLKQEEELKKQRDLLRQASTMAEVGYWELDLATSEVFWSEITGKIHETPEGFHPTLEEGINFYDEASRPIITETVNQSIKTGNGWDIELKIITATNKRKWVRSIAECYTQNGVVTKIAGVFQDISESKNREAQILESKSQTESLNALLSADIQQKKKELITTKERYSILYNNAPDMMASIDVASKKIIDCNEQTAKC
jgi:PAS domain-containing protein